MPINKAHADTYLDKLNGGGMQSTCCPCCGETDIYWEHRKIISHTDNTVHVTCSDCGGKWVRSISRPYRFIS